MAKADTETKKDTTKKSSAAKKSESGESKAAAKKPAQKTSKASAGTSTASKKAAKPKAKTAQPAQAKAEPEAATQAATAQSQQHTLDNVELPATHGKVGVFGGPKDRGIKPDDKLALPTGRHFVYERVHSLNPKSFYCAMRWDYRQQHRSPEEGKRWWANKKLIITNTKTGASVVVRAVDYGPHENTGLDIGISPGAAEALGVEVGDEVDISFADQRAALGTVE